MTTHRADTPEEMLALGASAASFAKHGNVFALVGTLGTGKTHWSKGFVSAIDSAAVATSPTFPIVNEYRGGRIPIFHFDFYRLKSAEELIALGWDEYLDEDAIVICEWADLFPEIIPSEATWLEITHQADGSRQIREISRPEKGEPQ
ncbi:MAG: tRNA (adenosine(37)-N6)-threonylcarbamoyltransferase complex ATPase subunit type 1 TsaE [Akkermansiaceae bacterium]|jgi:tRNA threonylcarbamoyladenosine biosynthesis protein TsaE|nr:tRNA (adenosine(37)-N6)-threonylcarbamoyltransferase complex ATPase subunit type 1 TsaE [Akkermansiaceae bacterium]MDP4647779.1 tRNA (adenosine(37)-N6)-threonylcarbamoyltransferase complex ATPase subunit type 1 TsaE [Akkermansiaceae bacterium]MDP4719607.1 tRNA (adenosine(37)-N6)-threonylcarbamoyltransferase complex ATPase subunit type 1 TsaE [Akkermansiaceae bacterium]MDP4780854.1 tRNA (adenosine(37)-N6)-threonylcarbamoyltransferase complex ATPase subunit type 1 TsaE [Akkermansiaceae bacteriu